MDNNQAIPKSPLDTAVFRETVPVVFSFLVTEYGSVLTQENEYLFTVRSKFCVVRIYLEWGDVVVTLQPIDARQVQGPRTTHRELGLAIILAYLDPKVEWSTGLITKPEEFTARIHQLAMLLRTYCSRLLRGDFSGWPKFEAYGESLVGAWKKKQEKLVSEVQLRHVRSKAETAFREKDYTAAIALYESIRNALSPSEWKKIEYARKQLEKSGR